MILYSIMGLAYYVVPCLLPVIVIGAIVFAVYRVRKGKEVGNSLKKENLIHFFDLTMSQLSIAFSVLFLLYFLFSITKSLNVDIEAHLVALVALVVGFGVSYYFKQQFLLFLSVISAYGWWIWFGIFEILKMQQSYVSDFGDNYYGVNANEYRPLVLPIGILLISLLYYLIAKIHSKKRGYNYFDKIYYLWAIIPGSLMLMLASIKIVLVEVFPYFLDGDAMRFPPLVIIGMMVICMAIVLMSLYAYIRSMVDNKYLSFIMLVLIALGLSLFIPELELKTSTSNFPYSETTPNFLGYLLLIFFNISIFAEFLLIIYYGYLKKNVAFVTMGTIMIFFLCIEKYIEWFSFTEKGIFFTGAGILMLGLGFGLERARRSIIHNLNTNQNSTEIDGKQ